MKSKVAICIAGEMRYWEITKDIFNSFDADIFISTWDTNDRQDNYPYKFHGNNNMNMDIINSLDNLKEAEFLPKEKLTWKASPLRKAKSREFIGLLSRLQRLRTKSSK